MNKYLNEIDTQFETFTNDLFEILKKPSISTDPAFREDVRSCAEFLADHVRTIGLENCEVIQTDKHPIVYADWCHAPNQPTVLIYGHYDVQPSSPDELWTTPAFSPEIREGFIYARGVSDDKGQVYCHLKAIQTLLMCDGKLPVNVKLCIEGEEEIGSESLKKKLPQLKEKLRADVILISDSPMYDANHASICYSLRGMVYTEITLVGPNRDLHSGQHGGVVHNPIQVLASLIASLKDTQDRVLIPGFYQDVRVIDDTQREQLSVLPFDEEAYAKSLGVSALAGDQVYTPNMRKWFRPTLDVTGITGGYQGKGAKTIIPSKASAKISMRLVANQNPEKILKAIKNFLTERVPEGIKVSFEDHSLSKPVHVSTDSDYIQAAKSAFEWGFKVPVVFHGEGGSIPIVNDFKEVLGIDTVFMGFNLPDDAIHSPNERFKVSHYQKGIQTSLAFLLACKKTN